MQLWTFGDSFASTSNQETDWFYKLSERFSGEDYFNLFCDARDTQTIMDSFYRNLCNIEDNSLVVIWLPSLARIRYPKKPEYFSKLLEASFTIKNDFYDLNNIENIKNFDIVEYFTHFPYYNYPDGKAKPQLDFPFDTLDFNHLHELSKVSYVTHEEGLEEVRQNLEYGVTPIDFYKLIQISKSSIENWNKIFSSLKKFCNFEILLVSWTNEYNEENVISKTQLTKDIGFWHTKHQEYEETNGKNGLEWDEHFSTKMNIAFSDWIMNRYPNYFNK